MHIVFDYIYRRFKIKIYVSKKKIKKISIYRQSFSCSLIFLNVIKKYVQAHVIIFWKHF